VLCAANPTLRTPSAKSEAKSFINGFMDTFLLSFRPD
jgi:hypothetical protein